MAFQSKKKFKMQERKKNSAKFPIFSKICDVGEGDRHENKFAVKNI